jgi:hypothetical protein
MIMPTYNVTLSRAYTVSLRARNEPMAKRIAEFFIGNPPDSSADDPKMRKRYGFKIDEIEMVENEAIAANEVNL